MTMRPDVWHGLNASNAALIDRFNNSYVIEPNCGCWLWDAAFIGGQKIAERYYRSTRPVINVDGKRRTAHRVAYELFIGPIPAGAHICHHCDVELCVNPKHLYAGSMETNMRDRSVRERGARTRLTTAQVVEIISDKRSNRTIAKAYGVGRETIGGIRRGLGWKHIPRSEAQS